jgi:anti-sigma factor RsiW
MNTNTKLTERDEIEAMLPWFAAGTLNRKDTARVEAALKSDTALAQRFELVREELGETIRLNEDLGAPSSRALKALFEKIDAEAPRQSAASFNLIGRISEFVASFSPRTLAYAGAVAALALVLQAGVITSLVTDRGDANYKTVSVDPGQGAFALVRFAPNATAADITKFLEDNKAVVVDGPKAGMYRIRLAVTGMPKEELARIIKQMQDNKNVSVVAPVQ